MRVLDRQGKFQGDLHYLQRFGLTWLMNREIEEQGSLEKYRTINTGLASNPATSGEFLQKLMEDDKEVEVYETDEDWMAPENIEQIEDMLQGLSHSDGT